MGVGADRARGMALLSVVDDGWVETPGFARALSDNRADLRRALLGLGILFGGLGMIG